MGARSSGARLRGAWVAGLIMLWTGCGASSPTNPGSGGQVGTGGASGGASGTGGTFATGGNPGLGGAVVGSGGSGSGTGGAPTTNGGAGGAPSSGGGTPGGGGEQGGQTGGGRSGNAAVCGSGTSTVFCEDFEEALGTEWIVVNGTYGNGCAGHSMGVGQRDMSLNHSGMTSWHANIDYKDIDSCQAELRRQVSVPAPDAFVRMFVYLPASSVVTAIRSFEMSMLYETRGYGAVGPTITGGILGFEGYGDITPAKSQDATRFPTDKWVCLEWQFHQGTKPTFAAWLDGAQAIAPTDVKLASTLAGPLDGIFFGIYGYTNMGPVDIWLDDVALSATRIGCEASP